MSKGIKWDLTSLFKEFGSEEYNSFRTELHSRIDELQNRLKNADPLTGSNGDFWEKAFLDLEACMERVLHFGTYAECLSSAYSDNEDYASAEAEFNLFVAQQEKIKAYLTMGLKDATDKEFEEFVKRPAFQKGGDFFLETLRAHSKHTMSSDLEALAQDLSVDGFSSWSRLYNTITGKLMFEMQWPCGKKEMLPISQCRSLCADPDREIRKSAFINGNKAWETIADSCAAALNAIAGTRLLLNEKRGYGHFLDVALEQARLSKKTLDAMFEAIDECRPFIEEAGEAKADALGIKKLTWYDCEAALKIPGTGTYTWEECVDTVDSAMGRAYPALQNYFRTALKNHWIESEPRPGKRPGAFCLSSSLIDESRVFMTFTGSQSDISTLAHETGHAFHSYQLNGGRACIKEYPMTLAETASTFSEMLLADGILSNPKTTDNVKLDVVTNTVNDILAYLIDIPIRFKFEKAFHEERMKGEVSVSRLKELMTAAMKEQFGSLLEEGGENEMFWASKLHFYALECTFYNFPYIFGFLLSRGLYGMFKKEGAAFLPKYEAFLQYSGSNMAHVVAQKTLGVNIEEKEFWINSIMSLKPVLEQFKELVKKVLK